MAAIILCAVLSVGNSDPLRDYVLVIRCEEIEHNELVSLIHTGNGLSHLTDPKFWKIKRTFFQWIARQWYKHPTKDEWDCWVLCWWLDNKPEHSWKAGSNSVVHYRRNGYDHKSTRNHIHWSGRFVPEIIIFRGKVKRTMTEVDPEIEQRLRLDKEDRKGPF